jgi:hypothetical protein
MANSSVLLGGTGSSVAEGSSLRSDAASSIRARSSLFDPEDDFDERSYHNHHHLLDDDDSAYRSPSPRASLASEDASTVSREGGASPAAATLPTPSHADRLRASVAAALQRPKSAAAAAVGSRLSRFSLSPTTSSSAVPAASPPGSSNGTVGRPASSHGGGRPASSLGFGEDGALGTRAAMAGGVRRLRWRRSGVPAAAEEGGDAVAVEDEDARSER